MATKTTIDLNYSGEKLWWSTDGGVNWGIVGPSSPVSVLNPGADVSWKGDKTIDSIEIQLDSTKIMERVSGVGKDKSGKVKSSCKNGDKCKYTILVTPAGAKTAIAVDPDLKVCEPPCNPGGGG